MDTGSATRTHAATAETGGPAPSPATAGRRREPACRICILLNGAAGRSGPGSAAATIRAHAEAGSAAIVLRDLTGAASGPSFGEACRAAAGEGFGVVAAAGGAAVAPVAACLAGTGLPTGRTPLGTFSYLARTMASPRA
mgnify:CR=1 FL=1